MDMIEAIQDEKLRKHALRDYLEEEEKNDKKDSWFDRKTLDEIHEHDVDNLANIYKASKYASFSTMEEMRRFIGACIHKGVSMCGEMLRRPISLKPGDQIKLSKGVIIERRNKYKDQVINCRFCGGAKMVGGNACPKCEGTGKKEVQERWRNGIYIYFKNEIISFISEPRRFNNSAPLIIRPGLPPDGTYMVMTNMRP